MPSDSINYHTRLIKQMTQTFLVDRRYRIILIIWYHRLISDGRDILNRYDILEFEIYIIFFFNKKKTLLTCPSTWTIFISHIHPWHMANLTNEAKVATFV